MANCGLAVGFLLFLNQVSGGKNIVIKLKQCKKEDLDYSTLEFNFFFIVKDICFKMLSINHFQARGQTRW